MTVHRIAQMTARKAATSRHPEARVIADLWAGCAEAIAEKRGRSPAGGSHEQQPGPASKSELQVREADLTGAIACTYSGGERNPKRFAMGSPRSVRGLSRLPNARSTSRRYGATALKQS
jgi:hypothetical protein